MKKSNGIALAVLLAGVSGFAVSAAAQAPPAAPMVDAAQQVVPTTRDRLINADDEPQNWLMYNGNYSGWHYSRLDQINKDNVAGLRIVFQVPIGGCATATAEDPSCSNQSSPLAEDGRIYVVDNQNKVMSFDVTSGDRAVALWRHDPGVERPDNARGLALYGDWVIQTTADARIIAIDKATGEVVWEATSQEPVDQPNSAEAIATRRFTGPPGVIATASGKNIITVAPRGAGVGWMAAYDADNEGELLWRTYTIPQPGEPNFGTWPDDKWRWGAAMPWGPPPTYDAELNLLYVGTGEPSPVYDPEFRPGDNLYSVSTLALNADDGALIWYFQEVPNDQWDYDSTATRFLHEFTVAGETHRAVTNWARNGFLYTVDAANGEFLQAVPQVDNINWTAGIDPKTGKPVEYDPNAGLQTYGVAGPRRGRAEADAPLVCATWGGGTTGIWPQSYDPNTGISYNTRTLGCTYQTILRSTDEAFNPLQREGLGSQVRQVQIDTQAAIIAIDVASGQVVNTQSFDLGIPSDRQAEVGALATEGGLVFTAFDDGSVRAFDKDTLEQLWIFHHGTGMKGGMISYAVGDRQFVAHLVGDNPGSSGIKALMNPTAMLVVYGL